MNDEPFNFVVYIFALVGAAIGGTTAFLIAKVMPAIEDPRLQRLDEFDDDDYRNDRRRHDRAFEDDDYVKDRRLHPDHGEFEEADPDSRPRRRPDANGGEYREAGGR